MRAGRVFVASQTVLAGAAVAWASLDAASRGLTIATAAADILVPIALGAALLILGLFNVWLPRGDAVDTTVAVAFATGILVHQPLLAAGVVILARCATVALRPQGQSISMVAEQVSRRAILICASYALFVSASPRVLTSLDPRLWDQLALLGVAAVLFIAFDAMVEQAHTSVALRTPLLGLVTGVVRLQGWMLAAEMSVAVLAVVMFPSLRFWGLLITVGLLLVMRQSFALLLEVRASYTATVEVLARSLEAYDPQRRGHAERVASMVGSAGRLIGLQGKALEKMTYAALFHDVGRLGTDSADESPGAESAQVLANVGFLAAALPILRVLDTSGEVETSLDEEDLIGAYLIASLSAIDSEVFMQSHEERELANAIGARLYAATRRSVDRVIGRIEQEAREGRLRPSELADVVL